jgi:hypothetical protein
MSSGPSISTTFRTENVLSALLLLAITNYFPHFHKTWFVEETGNIHIAPLLGWVVAIGLILQKHWARKAGLAISCFLLLVAFFEWFSGSTKPGFVIMLLCGGFSLYLLRPIA